jgi:Secretion system C-terminal sorting domain
LPSTFVGASQSITGLFSGDYQVTITNGCQTISKTVHLPSCYDYNGELNVIFNPKDACKSVTEGGGYLIVTPTGGRSPYSYKWEGSSATSAAIKIDNNHDEIYRVTVSDYCGQKKVEEIFLPCDCNYQEKFSANFIRRDPCLTILTEDAGVGTYGSSFISYHTDPFPDYLENFTIEWEGSTAGHQISLANIVNQYTSLEGIEITYGIDFYDVHDKDEVQVTVTDILGCKLFKCFAFGKAKESVTSYSTENLSKIIDWLDFNEPFDNYQVYSKCSNCDVCGGDCDGPLGYNPTCEGEPNTIKYSSMDGNFKRSMDKLENPCTSGSMKCDLESAHQKFIPSNVVGVPFPDYRSPIGEFEGHCVYPCGCLFAVGEIPGVPSDHPFYLQSEIIGSDICEKETHPGNWTSNDPPEIIEGDACPPISYAPDPSSYDRSACTYNMVCPPTGEIISEIVDDEYCFSIRIFPGTLMCTKANSCKFDNFRILHGDLAEELPYDCNNPENLAPCFDPPGFKGENPEARLLVINANKYYYQTEVNLSKSINISTKPQNTNLKSKITNRLSITPNPSTGKFTLKTTATKTPTTLRIWNATSQQIFQKNLDTGIESLQIDLSGNPPGVYTLFLSNENGTEVAKIVVQ